MIPTQKLLHYLKEQLKPDMFCDYCPNGLQVAGREDIGKIISGVSATQALLDAAVAQNADAILVHHGFFWKGEDPCVVGIKQKRLATLLRNDINLIAYHLPLDVHPKFGNNAQLAKRLGMVQKSEFAKHNSAMLGCIGQLNTVMSGEQLCSHIHETLNRDPFYIPGTSSEIKKIAWCTGAAQDFLEQAAQVGVDAYITGEVSERTVPLARELGIHFYAAGHHATERYGVKALGDHLASQFNLDHQFIDIDNPV